MVLGLLGTSRARRPAWRRTARSAAWSRIAGGEPLVGVAVTAVATDVADRRAATTATTTTDAAGEYELVLAAGTWAVTFAREGFETEQRGDVWRPGGEPRQLDVTFALPPFRGTGRRGGSNPGLFAGGGEILRQAFFVLPIGGRR